MESRKKEGSRKENEVFDGSETGGGRDVIHLEREQKVSRSAERNRTKSQRM